MTARTPRLLAAVALVVAALAGCSSTDIAATPDSAAPPPPPVAENPLPVEIDAETNLLVDLGAQISVTNPGAASVRSDNTGVVADADAVGDEGPIAVVIGAGTAELTVYDDSGAQMYQIFVTAQDPATFAPEPPSS